MQLVLKFRHMLPTVVREELDSLVATISGFFAVEHNPDGTHANITASSITIGGVPVVPGGGGGGSLPTTTKGDLIAHNGTTNVRVPVGSDGRVLTADTSGAAGLSWQLPSGPTLPVAISDGGTGQTSKTPAFDALAPGTTKGDLIAYNGTDHVRVAVGANTQVLTADTAAAAGVSWQTPVGVTGAQNVQFSAGATTGHSPADASTYTFGLQPNVNPGTTGAGYLLIAPLTGTIVRCYGTVQVTSILGSAGLSTVTVLNSTASTSEQVSNAVPMTAVFNAFSKTGMTLAVTAGDRLLIQVLTPTWATNPTGVFYFVTVVMQ